MSAFKLSCTDMLDGDLLARLRRVVVDVPTIKQCAAMMGTTVQTLEDALTGGRLKPATIERLRAAVEAHERKAVAE